MQIAERFHDTDTEVQQLRQGLGTFVAAVLYLSICLSVCLTVCLTVCQSVYYVVWRFPLSSLRYRACVQAAAVKEAPINHTNPMSDIPWPTPSLNNNTKASTNPPTPSGPRWGT